MRPSIITDYILQPIKTLPFVTVGTCLTLLSSIVLTSTAPAVRAAYTPPEGDSPSGSTVAGGSRTGCDTSSDLPFTVLAPSYHVGQTTTTTPTLAWFVTATAPYRLRISVYDPSTIGAPLLLYSQETIEDQGGLGHITLASEDVTLVPGQQYIWQVAIACDPTVTSYQVAIPSDIYIVEPSNAMVTELDTGLATASTPMERADVYASSGYWFNALNEALVALEGESNPSEPLATLLSDLGQLEVSADENSLRGEHLLQLAEWFKTQE